MVLGSLYPPKYLPLPYEQLMGMERAVTSLVTGKHSGGLPWPFGLVLATNMCHLLATALTYQKRVWQKGTGLFHKRTRSFIFLPLYEGRQASWIP